MLFVRAQRDDRLKLEREPACIDERTDTGLIVRRTHAERRAVTLLTLLARTRGATQVMDRRQHDRLRGTLIEEARRAAKNA